MSDVVQGNFEKEESMDDMLQRLAANASRIYDILAKQLMSEGKVNMRLVLTYASGLAGIACHEAVKAGNQEQVQVQTKDGKNFYFGDAVNKYIFENKTSIFSFVRALTKMEAEDAISIDAHVSKFIGSELVKVHALDPVDVYKNVKLCWDGIYENAIHKVCRSYEEWPVLMGILLQNVIYNAMKAGAPAKDISMMAMEGAIVLSKMDVDSI